MSERYAELRRLALAATPGPWTASWDFKRLSRDPNDGRLIAHGCGPQLYSRDSIRIADSDSYVPDDKTSKQMQADAAYIAAVHPQALLALLADNKALREALEAVREWLLFNEHLTDATGVWAEPFVKANNAVIAALASALPDPKENKR